MEETDNMNTIEQVERQLLLDIKAALMCAVHTKKPIERIAEDLLLKIKPQPAYITDEEINKQCSEKGCTEKATKDYNGHRYWVCNYHYEKLNNYFDEEYR